MKRYRGFTMMEMSVVISLCMVLLLLTAVLFTTSTRLIKAQHTTGPQLDQFDAMVGMLREDVWLAQLCSINQQDELMLVLGRESVVWQKDEQTDQIIRTQGQHRRYYPRQQVALHFVPATAGVDLRIDTPKGQRPVTMRLLSEHLLKEAQHDR